MSYTQDREARRRRLKARGIDVGAPMPVGKPWKPKCARCGDNRQIVKQGRGMVPCPECCGAA